jgi:hypothetical protein
MIKAYMRDKIPEMEYVFMDTGEELPETYEYLQRVESYLGKSIVRLKNNRQGFKDLLDARRGFLPSPKMRWCTHYLKIKPFEEYVGDDPVISYVAIRADELQRKGYISTKPNITAQYPFIEDGLIKDDILRILEESGLGLPEYYKWRSRSGCYFCFFQQRVEWVGLLENHPDLYWKAAAFERVDAATGERYTWSDRESLSELAHAERIAQIKAEYERRQTGQSVRISSKLTDLLADDDEDREQACLICHL